MALEDVDVCQVCAEPLPQPTRRHPRRRCQSCHPGKRSQLGYHTPKSCGYCGKRGHNIRTCMERAADELNGVRRG